MRRTPTHNPAAVITTEYRECKPNSIVTIKNALGIAVLGLLMTLAGCFKSGTNRSEPAQGGTPQTAASPQATTASSTPQSSAPAAVIATADGERGGTRVEITELKRLSDNTLNLKFAIVNDTADNFSFSYDFGDSDQGAKDYNTVGGVTLLDGVNKKKYFVVRDTENNCVCSRDLKPIPSKSRGNVWAKFPAPPDDVQKISIVIPHFSPIDDAPISR